jgi:hypothetical protein
MLREEGEVVVPVQFVVRATKEEEEILVAGQVFDGGKLQLEDAKMAAIEIDGVDVLRLVDEIIEDVAAAGGDGEHPAFGRQGEGLEIDPRVLPNLVVNETIEPEGE